MTLQSLIEARRAEAEKLLICPNTGCDHHGTIAVQVGEDEWDPQQCQYCYEVIIPLRAHTTQTIIAILEAQCALLEGRKKQPLHSSCTIEYRGYNSALSEIISSNRDLLDKLQS